VIEALPGGAPSAGPNARNSSSSLRRALAILNFVRDYQRGSNGPSLSDISRGMSISKSGVLRLAAPLLEEGLLERSDAHGSFRIGVGGLLLGQSYLDNLDLRTVANPFLLALAEKSGHTCHLVIPDGVDVVYIDKVETRTTVRMASRVGNRVTMQSTAVGKALLSCGEPELLDRVISTGLAPSTSRTITDPDLFRREIERSARRGYAIDDRENQLELRCVAAPIFGATDKPIGALSVSALATLMPARAAAAWGKEVALAGLRISVGMGSGMARRHLTAQTG
jgi:DNA-binding IclR family transcriptional regulator